MVSPRKLKGHGGGGGGSIIVYVAMCLVATLAVRLYFQRAEEATRAQHSDARLLARRDIEVATLHIENAALTNQLAKLVGAPPVCTADDCAAVGIVDTPCVQAPCAACPACSGAPKVATDYTYHPEAGFAGGLVEWADRGVLYLPPDFCFVPSAPDIPRVSNFKFLAPDEVAYDANDGCYWAELAWRPPGSIAPVSMCTHNPKEDKHVSAALHGRKYWIDPQEMEIYEQVVCTPARPFMIDIGSNIGSYSIPAAASG